MATCSTRFKDIFKTDTKTNVAEFLRFGQNLLYPLIISNCNGTGPWSFTDATIEYTKSQDAAFPTFVWYSDLFLKIAEGKTVFEGKKKEAIDCLLDCGTGNDKHIHCLRSILKETMNEAKVKTVLAVHYFQPLIPQSHYVIDRGSLDTCELCKTKINYGDTSFGNGRIWHGMADIVLHKSIIKVSTEELDESEEESENEEGFACGSLSKKQKTTMSENGNDSPTSMVEVKLPKTKIKKAESQALAQGIVNAFCEAKRYKSLSTKFLPSFLATPDTVRIILYNCDLDVLLFSEEFPIWNGITLNAETLWQVWFLLNFDKFEINPPDYVLEKIPSSKFKDIVGDVYSIYLENVTRPLEPLENRSNKADVNTKIDLVYYKQLRDFGMDFYKNLCNI